MTKKLDELTKTHKEVSDKAASLQKEVKELTKENKTLAENYNTERVRRRLELSKAACCLLR